MSPTRHSWRAGLTLFLLAVASATATGQTTNEAPAVNSPARHDYASFRIISDRNIFDANRSGVPRTVSRRAARVETVSLVGTLSYEKGTFAFFEGSSSEYTKALKADGMIAGYKLAGIAPNAVTLEANGKQIELPVGSQLRREDAGEWTVAAASESNFRPGRGGDSNSRNNRGADLTTRFNRGGDANGGIRTRRGDENSGDQGARAPAAPSEDPGVVLKRLMEQREKESK